MEKGTVWIVGGSSGLGLATAKAFADDGWLVISGARSFHAQSLETPIRELPLDVRNKDSRAAFIREAFKLNPRVDVLVYCAAILVLSPCELTPYEDFESVMQTNFLGMTDFVAQAMPKMREQKRGKIVLFSSINGLLGTPFQSAYVASKHAVEGYAECLALECEGMGIQVSVVEPGDHRGGSQRCRMTVPIGEDSPYWNTFTNIVSQIRQFENLGLLPSKLAQKVLRNVNRRRMRFRIRIAKADQKAGMILHDTLPYWINIRILSSYYRKKG